MQKIFVHGLSQTPASWDQTITGMSLSSEVSTPDVFGLVEGKEVTYDSVYQAFSAYCNRFEGQLDICGLSVGGILAVNYAMDHPQKVHSLVLIGARYSVPKQLFKLQNLIFRMMPDSAFEALGFTKKDYFKFADSMNDLDLSAGLKNITCPTMVACGIRDVINKRQSINLASRIKGATYVLLEHAGHEINTENPKQLAMTLELFYNNELG